MGWGGLESVGEGEGHRGGGRRRKPKSKVCVNTLILNHVPTMPHMTQCGCGCRHFKGRPAHHAPQRGPGRPRHLPGLREWQECVLRAERAGEHGARWATLGVLLGYAGCTAGYSGCTAGLRWVYCCTTLGILLATLCVLLAGCIKVLISHN